MTDNLVYKLLIVIKPSHAYLQKIPALVLCHVVRKALGLVFLVCYVWSSFSDCVNFFKSQIAVVSRYKEETKSIDRIYIISFAASSYSYIVFFFHNYLTLL
jgi:hypothetical protein